MTASRPLMTSVSQARAMVRLASIWADWSIRRASASRM